MATIQGFSARLQEAMFNKGWSVLDLSHHTGISDSSLWYYVNGYSLPGALNIARMCAALCISADWLLGIDKKNRKM